MELRMLRCFLKVAQEGNITKAAALLHISQPALSRTLRQLEEELGVQLFVRSSHSVALTSEGELLERRAQEMVDLEAKTKMELGIREELTGEIGIGTGDLKSFSLLAEWMEEFQHIHPGVKYSLFSGDSGHIKEKLEQGSIDFGLLLTPVNMEEYAWLEMPVKERWGAWVPKQNPLASKQSLSPEDIAAADTKIIIPHRGPVRQLVLDWTVNAAEPKTENRVAAQVTLPYSGAIYAAASKAIYFSVEVESKFPGLVFLPLEPPVYSETVLVWKRARRYSALMQAFLDFLKEKTAYGQTDLSADSV